MLNYFDNFVIAGLCTNSISRHFQYELDRCMQEVAVN